MTPPCPFAVLPAFRLVYMFTLFVGEAYMPPGRGVPHAGFPGKSLVPAALQCKANGG